MSSIGGASLAGTAWFLNGIENLQQQQTKTIQELTSGFQVQDASDAPALTPQLVNLGSSLASVQAYQTDLTSVQAEASTADGALGSGISLLENAQTLGSEGAGSTSTAAERQTLATQVQGLQQQIVSIANTAVAGRYIFAGGADQSPPYQYDATNTTSGVNALTKQTAGGVIVNPGGAQVYQGLSGDQIFNATDVTETPTASNVFVALQALSTALLANDQPGIASALDGLQSASTYLGQQQAYYGESEQRLSSEQSGAATQVTTLTTQIGAIRDTNITQAATDLSQEQVDQAAAYGAESRISTKTLFDYLG